MWECKGKGEICRGKRRGFWGPGVSNPGRTSVTLGDHVSHEREKGEGITQ